MFPAMARRISSGVAGDPSRRKAAAATIWPGVQKPHWKPPCSAKDRLRSASSSLSPSTVTTSDSTRQARTRQARRGESPTSTVQEPHSPRPQASLAPVRPSWSRSTLSKVVAPSAFTSRSMPFTRKRISDVVGASSSRFSTEYTIYSSLLDGSRPSHLEAEQGDRPLPRHRPQLRRGKPRVGEVLEVVDELGFVAEGIVGPEEETVGSDRRAGAGERGNRPRHRVVVERSKAFEHPRLPGQSPEAGEDERDRFTEVGNDEPQGAEPLDGAGEHEAERRQGVLEGRAHEPRQVVTLEPGSGPSAHRVEQHRRSSAIELLEHRHETRVVQLLPAHRTAEGVPDDRREPGGTLDLGEALVDVGKGKRREGAEAPRVLLADVGELVVEHPSGVLGVFPRGEVGL